MNMNLKEVLSKMKEFGQEYTEILIAAGACLVVLLLVLSSRKSKKDETPVQEEAPEEPQDEPDIQVEKIELENYEFEKEVEPMKLKVKDVVKPADPDEEPSDNRAKLRVAVENSCEQENLRQQIGNMGMKVCGNGDRLESVEIKIEKAQIIFKYRDESAEMTIADVSESAEESQNECEAAENDEVKSYAMSDEIGQALKKQAELENRKFGADNMNVSHSGRVFSEEELNDLIKE